MTINIRGDPTSYKAPDFITKIEFPGSLGLLGELFIPIIADLSYLSLTNIAS